MKTLLNRIAWGGGVLLIVALFFYCIGYAIEVDLDPRRWQMHVFDLCVCGVAGIGLPAGIYFGCKYEPR